MIYLPRQKNVESNFGHLREMISKWSQLTIITSLKPLPQKSEHTWIGSEQGRSLLLREANRKEMQRIPEPTSLVGYNSRKGEKFQFIGFSRTSLTGSPPSFLPGFVELRCFEGGSSLVPGNVTPGGSGGGVSLDSADRLAGVASSHDNHSERGTNIISTLIAEPRFV